MYDDWMEVYLKLHILSKSKRKSVRIDYFEPYEITSVSTWIYVAIGVA